MLTREALARLETEMGDVRVLSIYLDRLPDDTSRRALSALYIAPLLAEAEHAVETTHEDREAFNRCVARLNELLRSEPSSLKQARAWVAFIPARGECYVGSVPVEMPIQASWTTGPRLAPYVRALKHHVPEILAVTEPQAVRMLRYAHGVLEDAGTVRPQDGDDVVQRAAARLIALAGEAGWILITGNAESAGALLDALPPAIRGRAHRVRGPERPPDAEALAALAEREAAAASRRRDLEQVLELLDREAVGGRGISGFRGTAEAMRAGAVQQLYFTGAFVRRQPERAEALVRSALESGGGMEYVSAAAAARLDLAGGVGATLLFPVAIESALHGPGLAALVR